MSTYGWFNYGERDERRSSGKHYFNWIEVNVCVLSTFFKFEFLPISLDILGDFTAVFLTKKDTMLQIFAIFANSSLHALTWLLVQSYLETYGRQTLEGIEWKQGILAKKEQQG